MIYSEQTITNDNSKIHNKIWFTSRTHITQNTDYSACKYKQILWIVDCVCVCALELYFRKFADRYSLCITISLATVLLLPPPMAKVALRTKRIPGLAKHQFIFSRSIDQYAHPHTHICEWIVIVRRFIVLSRSNNLHLTSLSLSLSIWENPTRQI